MNGRVADVVDDDQRVAEDGDVGWLTEGRIIDDGLGEECNVGQRLGRQFHRA